MHVSILILALVCQAKKKILLEFLLGLLLTYRQTWGAYLPLRNNPNTYNFVPLSSNGVIPDLARAFIFRISMPPITSLWSHR